MTQDKTPSRTFTVVEKAGYEGEADIWTFDHFRDAQAFLVSNYTANERDGSHPDYLAVDIRQDWTDESGEEHSEYVY
jgi:hypothetical protein